MSYLGSGHAVTFRIPVPLMSGEAAAHVEGRVELGASRSPRAVLYAGHKVVAVLQGVNAITGLSSTPRADDFMVLIQDVERITVGGIRKDLLENLPRVPGLQFRSGSPWIEIRSKSGQTATFKVDAFDEAYSKVVSVLVSALTARDDANNKSDDANRKRLSDEAEEYDLGDDAALQATIYGALRYFPEAATGSLDDLVLLPCMMIGDKSSWSGHSIVLNEDLGFFEYSDCSVEDKSKGSPVLAKMSEITGCTVFKPEGFKIAQRSTVQMGKAAGNYVKIKILLGQKSMTLMVPLDAYDAEETPYVEKITDNFLKLINLALVY